VDPSEAELTKYVEAHKDELVKQFEGQGIALHEAAEAGAAALHAGAQAAAAGRGRGQGDEGRVRGGAQGGAGKIEAAAARLAAARTSGRSRGTVSEDADDGVARRRLRVGERRRARDGAGPGDRQDGARAEAPGTNSPVIESEEAFYMVRVDGVREGDVAQEEALRELAEEAVREASAGKELAKQAARRRCRRSRTARS
jgi:hypothetical protein